MVYSIDINGNKKQIIGQLTTVGIYSFKLEESVKGVIIYDVLKDKLITKLNF